MSTAIRAVTAAVLLVLAAGSLAVTARTTIVAQTARRHLLVVVDGLRPDYVTPEVMPALSALASRGVRFDRHHSIYPTVTRVNASSISTGAYPERHGLLGNTVFFPKVDPAAFLDTSDRRQLARIAESEGALLTAPTLGESLHGSGRSMLVVSSGSGGAALLNHHTVASGAILHPQFTLPARLSGPVRKLGPAPGEGAPAGARDRFAVDTFVQVGLPEVDPAVTVLWLGELDAKAHDEGVGAPATVAQLRQVDAAIQHLESGLKQAGVFEAYNIWVTSDHGFSTYTGGADVARALAPFNQPGAGGAPRIVSGSGAIYVRDHDRTAIAGIVAALQKLDGVGAIFTPAAAPGSLSGVVPGTLSFDAVQWAHPRSADILYSPDWSDRPNANGVRGTSASNGTAGHGSTSPWDIHNTLIGAGPDLKAGIVVDLPSGNLDLAPTFLTLLGVPIPAAMQGRALLEAFARADPPPATAQTSEHRVATEGDRYVLTAAFSTVTAGSRSFRYFDRAGVVRR